MTDGSSPGFARGRRLRSTPALRRLTAQTRVAPADLVLPVFVKQDISEPVPIGSMPGVVQHSLDSLRKAAHEAAQAGIGGLMLFGIPAEKDAIGSQADAADSIVNVALQQLRSDLGDELVLMADLCLCEYTDHGHCGVVTPAGLVDNDPTLDRYAAVAIAQAQAGAHLIAPSGMMDGQVAAIRAGLDSAAYTGTPILAYAAKYASATDSQRQALGKPLTGDRNAGARESGVVFQQFQGGVITAKNADASTPGYITWGRIREAWNVQRDPEGLLGAFAEELGGYRQQLKEAAVPVKEAQVEGKLSELGVTPADAPPPATPRAELPSGSFALTMRLRVSGIDARLPQRGKRRRITVPAADEAVALGVMEQWQVEPGDPLADGRTLLRRKALAVPA